MIKITEELLGQISAKAKISKRKRMNHDFHVPSDPIQRFLNALEPQTYLRPHKHEDPDKVEIFIILKGRALVVEFDETGSVLDHVVLDARTGAKGVEIPPRTWHTFVSLEENSVLYEIKDGPYVKETDKNFAEWAPSEGSGEGQTFNAELLSKLGIPVPTLSVA